MRLIDVERMIFKIPAELTERQRLRILNIIGESIEQTPTVEAIPIEWIEEYFRKIFDEAFGTDRWDEERPRLDAIDVLLDDWADFCEARRNAE